MNTPTPTSSEVSGAFITLQGERYYAISNVDKMAPFLINLVSDNDHWMFVASNGGVTAGRVSPETPLFPYTTVDKIYDSTAHTGCITLLRVETDGNSLNWEPFNKAHDGRYATTRNLYKNLLGNKLLFEEINHDLKLAFRYSWSTSNAWGFVRNSQLENLGDSIRKVELVDGFQNLLPAGTPRFTQTNSSYLVDAYKWTELDAATGLAMFTLFSAISDRAEPCESLRAATVFSLGLANPAVLLSTEQLDAFRKGASVSREIHRRGVRGAYLVNTPLKLAAGAGHHWRLVANVEQSQADTVALMQQLRNPAAVSADIDRSVAKGSDTLARIMAAGDGFQKTAEETVTAHHYANVLFNILRGGIVADQYRVSAVKFRDHVRHFNQLVYRRHAELLDELPEQIDYSELLSAIRSRGDLQLHRLCLEYLPITFGRRHGDPSRPWNQFAIRLTDKHGNRLLTYQGNWRDIFQNWEALLLGYPEFIESVIAKFVNASTVDGYNPYRITDEGIDWEVEEPDDPWSYIGYWGDHQIIYLLKLLELSQQFHPKRLGDLLHLDVFSYANVPYRIKPFEAVLENAKSTVVFDEELAHRIDERVANMGADGKLLLDSDQQVLRVNLLEKLLVPLLAKLGNLVIDGGIWLNTQRPEWNDANNAIVGQGLSMVTLYYLRRYLNFLQALMANAGNAVSLSKEVGQWLAETAVALRKSASTLGEAPADGHQRHQLLMDLGAAASRYRETVYANEGFSGVVSQDTALIGRLLDDALATVDHSIHGNLRPDGLYHAYNLLNLEPETVEVDTLYTMLEGQVAVLSSGAIDPAQAVALLERLFDSNIFRADQNSFLLYPDRKLPGFLEKNCIPAALAEAVPLLQQMHARGDHRVVERDSAGNWRFNADMINADALASRLTSIEPGYGEQVEAAREPLKKIYEQVFNHKAFTGRSGGMFGFEGLGSIYWHMVSKLLLAVQENFFAAREQQAGAEVCRQLGELYYRVREGIGFNKTPEQYGAFPTDAYSHTPGHAGAQQPGMTGQVKEEMLTRFAELGVRVQGGAVRFDPCLLRAREFADEAQPFRFLDIDGEWHELTVPAHGLAFTWCQVPFVYRLDDAAAPGALVSFADGQTQTLPALSMPADLAGQLFQRSGRIRRVDLVLTSRHLFHA